MSTWRSLLRIFWALKWPLLAELLAVIFWMVVLENAVGLIQREVFDQLTGEASVGFGIWELCAILVAIGVVVFTLFVGGVVLHDYSYFNVAAMLQRNSFSYLMELPAHRSLPSSPGEAVSRFRDDADHVAEYISQFKFFVAHMVFLPTALFIMARIDALMTFGVFVPIFVVVFVVNVVRQRIQEYRKESREAAGGVTGFIGEMFGAAEAIKVANAEERVLDRFDDLNAERKRTTLKDVLLSESLNAVFSNIQNIGTGFVLIVAARSLGTESFSVGDLSLFVFYLGWTQWMAAEVGRTLMRYRQVGVSLDRLRDLMPDAEPVELVRRRRSYLFGRMPEVPFEPKTEADRFESLEVEGLTYEHPGSGRGVSGVDLRLPRAGFVVVTGRIGSGKSTLLRAIMGSLPMQAGENQVERGSGARPGGVSRTAALRLRLPGAAAVQRGAALEHTAGPAGAWGGPAGRDLDGCHGARHRGAGRRARHRRGSTRGAALRRPGAEVGRRPHVRQGSRPAGDRRRVERPGREHRAEAVAPHPGAGRRGPGGVPPSRGLPPRRPHNRPEGRARRGGGAAWTASWRPPRRCSACGRETWASKPNPVVQ